MPAAGSGFAPTRVIRWAPRGSCLNSQSWAWPHERCVPRGLIFAARHPRPIGGTRECYGRLDVTLAEPAEAGAAALLKVIADPVERIVASPSSRTRLVAEAIRARTGAPLHLDDRLMEMDFGVWEGQPWTAISRAEIDAWAADPLHYHPGGGECVMDVVRRVRRAWPGIASAAENTLVLTHAGPIRCLLHLVRGVPLANAIQASVAYGSVTIFT